MQTTHPPEAIVKAPVRKPWTRTLLRAGTIFAVALCLGWSANRLSRVLYDPGVPAGFVHGIIHGATMPLAMPNLLIGMDIEIFAAHHTGRTYKLGYTFGVNACGVAFFGVLFWRLSRWRRNRRARPAVS
jgi:hypothetical protein